MDAPVGGERLVFGNFRLDPHASRLYYRDATGDWMPVQIGSRALDVLRVLLSSPGVVVSKDTIMDAVWPGVAVEPANLTVQIAALRRVLDKGRGGESCIQTVPGRGYRLDIGVTAAAKAEPDPPPALAPVADPAAEPQPLTQRGRLLGPGRITTAGAVAVIVLLLAAVWQGGRFSGSPAAPRLSLVVLPFDNIGGEAAGDYLVAGITDDLTTVLSHIPGAFVIARATAYTYRGKAVNIRQVGQDLNVRYVVRGSLRSLGDVLKVNVELGSAETGAQLWSDNFDQPIRDLAAGQEDIVIRMRSALAISLADIEAARSLRERPTNPDAFDLIRRARRRVAAEYEGYRRPGAKTVRAGAGA